MTKINKLNRGYCSFTFPWKFCWKLMLLEKRAPQINKWIKLTWNQRQWRVDLPSIRLDFDWFQTWYRYDVGLGTVENTKLTPDRMTIVSDSLHDKKSDSFLLEILLYYLVLPPTKKVMRSKRSVGTYLSRIWFTISEFLFTRDGEFAIQGLDS